MYKLATNALIKIINEKAYLNITLNEYIQNYDILKNDHNKRLFVKIVSGVVEELYKLDYYLEDYISGRIKPFLRNILRIGVYSIANLNIKDYYIINELVDTVKNIDFKGSKVVNAILRNIIRDGLKDLEAIKGNKKYSIKYSIPLEIVDLLGSQYKKQLVDIINVKSEYNSYRLNVLKENQNIVINYLNERAIKYEQIGDCILTTTSLIDNELFKEGYIIAQDFSSQQVANNILLEDVDTMLDTCSAPGGKSLHIASIKNNKIEIDACDIYEHKLRLINENAQKLGVTCIKTIINDWSKNIINKEYDLVLTDVPCSGLGLMHHKPDIKYNMTIEKINDIIQLQQKIINNAKHCVKIGGMLVYSTCTINKQENEEQIKKFLLENDNFILEKEKLLMPSNKQDGFYISILRRTL